MPVKYFIYARKSTDEENKQVRSIEDQLTELKDFSQKENLDVVDILVEKQSAKIPGRPVFDQMLERIKAGQATGIISWHPDRLARNSVDGGQIIYLLDQNILQFLKFPTFWFENTPQGKFMLSLSFGQAKYYVDSLSQNIKRGLNNKAKRGEAVCIAPPGYINNRLTKKIEFDPKTAPAVKKAWKMYATGHYSYQQIADWLFSQGVTTKYTKDHQPRILAVNAVYMMLTNPIYYGSFKHNGEVYQGIHQPLISKDLFDRVQGVILTRSKNRKTDHNFALTNWMKCGHCHYKISAEAKKKYYRLTNRIANYIYYHCSKKWRMKCPQPYVTEPILIQQIDEVINEASIPQNWQKPLMDRLNQDEVIAKQNLDQFSRQLQTALFTIDVKLDKLLNSFLEGIITKPEYLNTKEKITTDKQGIIQKIDQLKRKQLYWLEPLKNHILLAASGEKTAKEADLVKKRQFLETVGSNFILKDQKLQFIWRKPWAALRAAATIRNFVLGPGFEPR
ncbi:MAG: recombinase family protein [Patescibacteria group bacterium]|nr:recombinase family protein [Patescibacteria group bacterium]